MNKEEMKNKISFALKDYTLQQGFEIICKENEKLKEDNWTMATNYTKMEQKFFNKLSKCKEIIKTLIEDLEALEGEDVREFKTVKEANQILMEC